MIPQPSTNPAQSSLCSVFRWVPQFSRWYERKMSTCGARKYINFVKYNLFRRTGRYTFSLSAFILVIFSCDKFHDVKKLKSPTVQKSATQHSSPRGKKRKKTRGLAVRGSTPSARAVLTVSRWDEDVAPVRRVVMIPTMARRRRVGFRRSSGRAARSSGSPGCPVRSRRREPRSRGWSRSDARRNARGDAKISATNASSSSTSPLIFRE